MDAGAVIGRGDRFEADPVGGRPADASRQEALQFRSFTLLPGARLLLRAGSPVEIGSRAFDVLHVLLRSRGTVVERAELVRRVWPSTIVEESNLRFQVSCVRKVLGKDRDLLKTVPGRGYLLALEVPSSGRERSSGGCASDGDEDLRALLRQVLAELRGARGPLRDEAAG